MTAFQDSFDFFTVGTGDRPFEAYDSSSDPTTLPPTYLVKGSKNVYKDDNNNINVRPGLKRYLAEDSSLNGIKSSYEWQTSFAAIRPIRVLAEGEFQVLFNDEWITLGEFDRTRFVFSTWWSDSLQQELLISVNGENAIYSWTGGITAGVGGVNTAGVLITGDQATTAMAASVLAGSERIVSSNNEVDGEIEGTNSKSAFVFHLNPVLDDTINFAVVNTGPTLSANVNIVFKTSLAGIASSATTGYVLIGATKEVTMANLISFFNSPGSDTATQIGIDDTDTITGLGEETYVATQSLESSDSSDWRDMGFTNGYPQVGSSISVDGITYTYTLVGDQYLINISGVPATGEVGFQTIYTNSGIPTVGFACDFIQTISNQLIVGSYSSPVIYFSADNNFIDYVNGGDLISGDPDSIVLDELPRGLIVVQGSVYIPAGSGNWYICAPNTPLPVLQGTVGSGRLVIVKVEKKLGAAKTAALAHEFLASIADTIVYLGQDHQLRMFGIFKDILGTKYPSVSIRVKQELIETDFTGGQLRCIGDNIYLIAPVPGLTFIYQQRDDVDAAGNIVSRRIWQPPQEWNISRIAVIDDVEYGYSNQSPEQYQLWNTDQWHDDTPSGIQAYPCVARFAYWQFKDRTKLGDLDKVFMEGYMFTDTNMTCTLRANYLGSTATEDVVISTNGDTPTLYTTDGILVGTNLIGSELIGGSTTLDGLPKFRVIADFKKHECFEYQMELSSFAEDARWQIITIGTNGSQVVNKPVNLRKG